MNDYLQFKSLWSMRILNHTPVILNGKPTCFDEEQIGFIKDDEQYIRNKLEYGRTQQGSVFRQKNTNLDNEKCRTPLRLLIHCFQARPNNLPSKSVAYTNVNKKY